MSIPEDKLEKYERIVASIPDVDRKGKTTPYTSLNGHMFSFLTKEGSLGLRLEASEREEFLKTYSCDLMEQHGRMMKEFVAVPESLDEKQLASWFQKSHSYTASLKPKPTKKK